MTPSDGPSTGALRPGLLLATLGLMVATACNPLSRGPSEAERRAPCDRLAAQAIDANNLDDARRLAARAADCYAELRGG